LNVILNTIALGNGENTITVGGSNTNAITVTVTDTASRCPTDYQAGDTRWQNYVYTITMQ